MSDVKTKENDRQVVTSENRLSYLQEEIRKATATKDALQAEIDKKAADYNIYIAQRDTDSKKMRVDILAQQDQLAAEKAEFQEILLQFQKEKQAHSESVNGFSSQKKRNEAEMNNIREFIKAVQRACSLIGL